MIAAIERAIAEHIDNEKKVVGSTDMKALYPSLDIGFTTDIVCEEFYNSEVEVESQRGLCRNGVKLEVK